MLEELSISKTNSCSTILNVSFKLYTLSEFSSNLTKGLAGGLVSTVTVIAFICFPDENENMNVLVVKVIYLDNLLYLGNIY